MRIFFPVSFIEKKNKNFFSFNGSLLCMSCMWCFAFVLFGHLHGMKQELNKISNCFLRRPTERTIYYLIISWESNFANPVSFRFMMKIAFVFWRKDINQNEPLILRYYGLGVVFSSSILTRLEETHNALYCPWLQLILKHWQTHFVVFCPRQSTN